MFDIVFEPNSLRARFRETFGDIAYPPKGADDLLADLVRVCHEVDANIREQIKAGVFPARLKPEDWNSETLNWLLDVIAPDRATTGKVIANFGRVAKGGDIRIHPLVAGLVEEGVLEKLGARKPAKGAMA